MALNTQIDLVAAQAACDGIVDTLDAGSAPKFRIYSGAQPASPDAATGTGTLLAEIALTTPAVFGAAADAAPGAVATALGVPLSDASANATGTAAWFRATINTPTNGVISGTVGTATADAIIDNTSIAAGQTVKLTAWTVTMPES